MKNSITLALIAIVSFAQAECCGPKAFDKMSDEKRAATGIEKLTAEERAELSAWISQKAKRGKRARFHKNGAHHRGSKARFHNKNHRNKMHARHFVIKEVDAVNGIIKTEKGNRFKVGPRSVEKAKDWKAGDKVLRFASYNGKWCTLKNLESQEMARAQKVRADVIKTIADPIADTQAT